MISGRLRSRLAVPLLLVYCGFLFFYGLGQGDLYRNETLRAILARQMLDSGDWIVPTLHGQPIFTKPPGMYWAIALCGLVFGEVNEWTARLPSALAATVVVFLFYRVFSEAFGRRTGLLAAFLTPLSIFWLERVPSAEIDMLQVAWVAAAILLFARAINSPLPCTRGRGVGGEGVSEPRRTEAIATDAEPLSPNPSPLSTGERGVRAIPIAALLCVAGGTLTKWTAPAFFYATIVPFLWWRGELRLLWSPRHLVGILLAAALVMGWIGAAISHAGWDVVYTTVSAEALQHLAPGHGRHAFPWLDMLLHPLKILAANLPWSLFALWSLRSAFWNGDERTRVWLQLLHCWIWPNVVFWSLASEHSLRQSAPLFPAFTGIAAIVLARAMIGRLQPRTLLIGFLVLWLSLKTLHVHVVVPQRSAQRDIRAKGERLAALVPRGVALHLVRLKDDGLLFYFGGPTLRIATSAELPPGKAFCILTLEEWSRWDNSRAADVIAEMHDAQGDPIVLVRVYSNT